ncbi:hypothetical protein DSM14862_03613 (plasmid) [Sulfitobacter indolifex]|nr:hypothetical protein DSM14862_03613 [Sulfitobacter indolifex]
MSRRDPFKQHRFPRDVILLAVRWYCRYPLSYRDVRDLLAERGITADAATIYRWFRNLDRRSGNEPTVRIVPGAGCSGMWTRPTCG